MWLLLQQELRCANFIDVSSEQNCRLFQVISLICLCSIVTCRLSSLVFNFEVALNPEEEEMNGVSKTSKMLPKYTSFVSMWILFREYVITFTTLVHIFCWFWIFETAVATLTCDLVCCDQVAAEWIIVVTCFSLSLSVMTYITQLVQPLWTGLLECLVLTVVIKYTLVQRKWKSWIRWSSQENK